MGLCIRWGIIAAAAHKNYQKSFTCNELLCSIDEKNLIVTGIPCVATGHPRLSCTGNAMLASFTFDELFLRWNND